MSTPSSPGSPTTSLSYFWQQKLQDFCRKQRIPQPIVSEMSDKRGGRTAWSCQLAVGGLIISARYWYDGKYINNAREDAAEVALQQLQVIPSPMSPQARAMTFPLYRSSQ